MNGSVHSFKHEELSEGDNSATRHLLPLGNRMVEKVVSSTFGHAGVEINGRRNSDVQIHNHKFFSRVALGGSLGLGEAYMDGWWDCEHLDEFFTQLLSSDAADASSHKWPSLWQDVYARIINRQSHRRAFEVGERHYDLGNDLYEAMLDKRMTYTCAYWKNAECIDDAQEAKLDLVCRKIGLSSGDRVLDVGCGWGSFAKFAAENYGAKVVGITVSKEQAELTRERCKDLPVEIRLQDYRDCPDAPEKFDRVVSLGMMEHVGYRNYRTYMNMIHENLASGGLALIQVIGTMKSTHSTDPWLDKYIFPNSMLPSVKQFGEAMDGLFMMQDWHSFGHYYDKTLMAWNTNFEQAWSRLSQNYDERFRRMWRYYLMFCAGIFRSGKAQLWQVVLSKGRVPGVYQAVR
jgi:cyclopropane-fatty-acyl-phospholipid synthase